MRGDTQAGEDVLPDHQQCNKHSNKYSTVLRAVVYILSCAFSASLFKCSSQIYFCQFNFIKGQVTDS